MSRQPGIEDEQALDAHIRRALAGEAGGRAPAVPGDFADRVVAARRWDRRRWRLAVGGVAALTAAAAAAVTLLVVRGGATDAVLGTDTGTHLARTRQEVSLAGRGVAVLEPDSELAWRREGDRSSWRQRAGDVFYRVEPGGPFRLTTPAGEVIVLGTCFRVEVEAMKIDRQGKIGFAAGAALAATVLVTVYEGRVRLASGNGQVELAAGEQGRLHGDSAPARIATERAAGQQSAAALARVPRLVAVPAGEGTAGDEVSRLREQVSAQAKELARLKMERGGKPEQHKYVDVSKEELLARADRCEIRYDTPPVLDAVPKTVSRGDLGGASDTERDAVNGVIAEMHGSVAAQLRRLYLEIGGEAAVADKMTPGSLLNELWQKVAPGELDAGRVRLARERAGVQAPPANPAQSSAGERLQRLMFNMGDEFERKLAERIGAERAHALRARHDGWGGTRSSHSGCPK